MHTLLELKEFQKLFNFEGSPGISKNTDFFSDHVTENFIPKFLSIT